MRAPAPRSWGDGENLTLSDAQLAACEPITGEGGKALRGYCPFHGSDRQRSLRVNVETGHFKCHACGAWGYLESARERRAGHPAPPPGARLGMPRQTAKPPKAPAIPPPPPPRPELAAAMEAYRAALPGSPGEAYLAARGIPLAIAQRAGVGYAASGTWAHRDDAGRESRGWHRGRLVFPHTDPAGNVVSLYGRAVGDDVPKGLKHDHLAGAKGYFNAQALRDGSGPVLICEGAFDALALMAAGAPRVAAIFGVNGWRWDWAKDARELIFALDSDNAGAKGFRELAPAARLRGKHVAYLEPAAYGGEKDAAAAWLAGTLTLGDWGALTAPAAPSDAPPPAPLASRPSDAPSEPLSDPEGLPADDAGDIPPRRWEDALAESAALLTPADKLAAYELSYAYFEHGPRGLAAIRGGLEAELAAAPAADALPTPLMVQCFAWANADYLARRRAPHDLPTAWRGQHIAPPSI